MTKVRDEDYCRLGPMIKCNNCKKEFLKQSERWAYKMEYGGQNWIFCSWHCLQQFRREHPQFCHKESQLKRVGERWDTGYYPMRK